MCACSKNYIKKNITKNKDESHREITLILDSSPRGDNVKAIWNRFCKTFCFNIIDLILSLNLCSRKLNRE